MTPLQALPLAYNMWDGSWRGFPFYAMASRYDGYDHIRLWFDDEFSVECSDDGVWWLANETPVVACTLWRPGHRVSADPADWYVFCETLSGMITGFIRGIQFKFPCMGGA